MTSKKSLDIFNNFRNLADASRFGAKARVKNIIDLYNERKIYNIKTAKALLSQLTDKKKNVVDSGIKRYNEVFRTYQNAEPLPTRRNRLKQEKEDRKRLHRGALGELVARTREKEDRKKLHRGVLDELVAKKKERSALKIQNLFRKTATFDIIERDPAMGDNVISYTLRPQRLSLKLMLEDLKTILYKAYYAVLSLLPKKRKFHFYSVVHFGKGDIVSRAYTYQKPAEWADHVEKQIETVIQSGDIFLLRQMEIKFNFFMSPAGGKSNSTQDRNRESILNKTSVARIENDDSNCFWYALSRVYHKGNASLKDNRNLRIREKFAKELCHKCKLPWDHEVSFLEIPLVEEALNCNICIMNMDNIPVLGSKIDVWNTLMYRSESRGNEVFWLLFDKNHYHAITNIKGFLSVDHFCNTCFKCFWRTAQFEGHECSALGCKKKKQNKDCKNHKQLAHYLQAGVCKGSKEEQELKAEKRSEKHSEEGEEHNQQRYIIYDFETDTSTLTHRPNHVEVDCIEIDEEATHDYDKCLRNSLAFNGYDCAEKSANGYSRRGTRRRQL